MSNSNPSASHLAALAAFRNSNKDNKNSARIPLNIDTDVQKYGQQGAERNSRSGVTPVYTYLQSPLQYKSGERSSTSGYRPRDQLISQKKNVYSPVAYRESRTPTTMSSSVSERQASSGHSEKKDIPRGGIDTRNDLVSPRYTSEWKQERDLTPLIRYDSSDTPLTIQRKDMELKQSPQEAISQLKASINSRIKSPDVTGAAERSQQEINKLRDRLNTISLSNNIYNHQLEENKRNLSHSSQALSNEDMSPSSASPYLRNRADLSGSSIDLSLGKESDLEGPSNNQSYIFSTSSNDLSNQPRLFSVSSTGKELKELINSRERERRNEESPEEVVKRSQNSPLHLSPGNMSLTKPRRKPPPNKLEAVKSSEIHSDYSSIDPISKQSSRDTLFGGELKATLVPTNETFEGREISDISLSDLERLPKFPDIDVKIDSHGKVQAQHKDTEASTDTNESSDEDSFVSTDDGKPLETPQARPAQNIQAHQPVIFKKTMRPLNRKKDKKLAFNENKPWKNHKDLSGVSENERKRYESLWVSNKGLYINSVVTKLAGVKYDFPETNSVWIQGENSGEPLSAKEGFSEEGINACKQFHGIDEVDAKQLIHGVVVKRLWQRSKLPNATLKSIWDMVDFRKDGTLNKVEFVVGMWLVDQCLYGRKLPKEVKPEIWDSLGNIGINVVFRKKK